MKLQSNRFSIHATLLCAGLLAGGCDPGEGDVAVVADEVTELIGDVPKARHRTVYVDTSHSAVPTDVAIPNDVTPFLGPTVSTDRFREALNDAGYEVVRSVVRPTIQAGDSTLLANLREDIGVVVLWDPGQPFTERELRALETFAFWGGRVVILLHKLDEERREAYGQLLDRFGLSAAALTEEQMEGKVSFLSPEEGGPAQPLVQVTDENLGRRLSEMPRGPNHAPTHPNNVVFTAPLVLEAVDDARPNLVKTTVIKLANEPNGQGDLRERPLGWRVAHKLTANPSTKALLNFADGSAYDGEILIVGNLLFAGSERAEPAETHPCTGRGRRLRVASIRGGLLTEDNCQLAVNLVGGDWTDQSCVDAEGPTIELAAPTSVPPFGAPNLPGRIPLDLEVCDESGLGFVSVALGQRQVQGLYQIRDERNESHCQSLDPSSVFRSGPICRDAVVPLWNLHGFRPIGTRMEAFFARRFVSDPPGIDLFHGEARTYLAFQDGWYRGQIDPEIEVQAFDLKGNHTSRRFPLALPDPPLDVREQEVGLPPGAVGRIHLRSNLPGQGPEQGLVLSGDSEPYPNRSYFGDPPPALTNVKFRGSSYGELLVDENVACVCKSPDGEADTTRCDSQSDGTLTFLRTLGPRNPENGTATATTIEGAGLEGFRRALGAAGWPTSDLVWSFHDLQMTGAPQDSLDGLGEEELASRRCGGGTTTERRVYRSSRRGFGVDFSLSLGGVEILKANMPEVAVHLNHGSNRSCDDDIVCAETTEPITGFQIPPDLPPAHAAVAAELVTALGPEGSLYVYALIFDRIERSGASLPYYLGATAPWMYGAQGRAYIEVRP